MKTLYVIWDTIAQDIIGGVHVHQHDAAAVRFFTDVLSDPHPNNMMARHPEHYELHALGVLQLRSTGREDGQYVTVETLRPYETHDGPHIILKGSTWAATINKENQK